MELIFGLLPPPVALGVIGVVVVAGLILRKKRPGSKITDTVTTVGDVVVTRDRIDKAVEAVLVNLRIHHDVADKIGDLVAEVILAITNQGRSIKAKSVEIQPLVHSQPHIIMAAAHTLAGPTPLTEVIREVAEPAVADSMEARTLVCAEIVKKYADGSVV